MTEAAVSFAGNLTDDPELRHTEAGIARAMFRVAVSGRRDQEASFFTVVVWRDQAEHSAESLAKGSRVMVVGRLQQRSWTAEDGSARSVVEVMAEELGASLRWGNGDDDQDDEPGAGGYRVGQDVVTSVTLHRGSSGSRIWPSTCNDKSYLALRQAAFYIDS